MKEPIDSKNPYVGPSFSFGNRLGRFVWGVVYLLLFKSSPRFAHGWRRFILRLFGARIGVHVYLQPNVKIWHPRNLVIGDYVGIGEEVNIYNMDLVEIGNYSSISMGVVICCGTHDYNRINNQLIVSPVRIGSYCWLCAESFVHPGITIPDGVVVGARSVVSKSPNFSWYVYGGFPAKPIKEREKFV